MNINKFLRKLIFAPIMLIVSGFAVQNPATGLFTVKFGTTFPSILTAIINLILGFAGIIAMLFIIIGGYQYVFSGANEELAKKGRQTLTNAIIGLIIIILSYVIVRVVATNLGAS